MQRSDGLVQRRRVVNSASSSSSGFHDGASDASYADKAQSNDSSFSGKDQNSNPTLDEESDKETRLTLMEEVLLLGLKDKEVRYRCNFFPGLRFGVSSFIIELYQFICTIHFYWNSFPFIK